MVRGSRLLAYRARKHGTASKRLGATVSSTCARAARDRHRTRRKRCPRDDLAGGLCNPQRASVYLWCRGSRRRPPGACAAGGLRATGRTEGIEPALASRRRRRRTHRVPEPLASPQRAGEALASRGCFREIRAGRAVCSHLVGRAVASKLDVTQDGPAAVAGLKPGDTIVAVDGRRAADLRLYALRQWLRDAAPGTKVVLRALQGNALKEVNVTLRELI
jgi:hypothetical protein